MIRRSTAIVLAILLSASLLANIFLVTRSARHYSDRPTAARPDSSGLQESLAKERARVQELAKTIEQLQEDKKVLAQESPPVKLSKVAAMAEKLRRMNKVYRDPKAMAEAGPNTMLELEHASTDIRHLTVNRLQDPKSYGEFLNLFFDICVEGEGTALTPAQKTELSKFVEEMVQSLAQLPPTPVGERMIKELELDASVFQRIESLLTEEQRAAFHEAAMSKTVLLGSVVPNSFSKKDAQFIIASTWQETYQLDKAQGSQALAAAQLYISTVARYESSSGVRAWEAGQDMISPAAYRYRITCLRAQLDALKNLEPSMTPAQLERVRTRGLQEFFMLKVEDGNFVPDSDK